MNTEQERMATLIKALAEYFDCEPENIEGYVIGCERNINGNLFFSSAWSDTPYWRLLGFAEELKRPIERMSKQSAQAGNGRIEEI